MLTEYSPYEELLKAMRVVVEYGTSRWAAVKKLEKASRNKRYATFQRVNTPAPHRYRAEYEYSFIDGTGSFSPRLIVDGKNKIDGVEVTVESFVAVQYFEQEGKSIFDAVHRQDPRMRNEGDFVLEVIHGHAIQRYMDRNNVFNGSLIEAQQKVTHGLFGQSCQFDEDGDLYVYFDGGVFLGGLTDNGRVIHLKTFVMNRKLYRNQRMQSLRSEKGREEILKKLKDETNTE